MYETIKGKNIFEAAAQDDVDLLKEFVARKGIGILDAEYKEEFSILYQGIANIAWYLKKGGGGTGLGLTVLTLATAPIITTPLLVGAAFWGGSSAIAYRAGNEQLANHTYTKEGWTPLHFAASSNAIKAAQYLIQAGANYNKTDAQGRTFYDINREGLFWEDHALAETLSCICTSFSTMAYIATNNAKQEEEKDQNDQRKELEHKLQVIQDESQKIYEECNSEKNSAKNLKTDLSTKNRKLKELKIQLDALEKKNLKLLKENSQLESKVEAQKRELEDIHLFIAEVQSNEPVRTSFQRGIFHRHTTQTAASATNTPAQRVSSLRT